MRTKSSHHGPQEFLIVCLRLQKPIVILRLDRLEKIAHFCWSLIHDLSEVLMLHMLPKMISIYEVPSRQGHLRYEPMCNIKIHFESDVDLLPLTCHVALL